MKRLSKSAHKILTEMIYNILEENATTTQNVFVVKVYDKRRGETRLVKPDSEFSDEFISYTATPRSDISDVVYLTKREAESAAKKYTEKFNIDATVHVATVINVPKYILKSIKK